MLKITPSAVVGVSRCDHKITPSAVVGASRCDHPHTQVHHIALPHYLHISLSRSKFSSISLLG